MEPDLPQAGAGQPLTAAEAWAKGKQVFLRLGPAGPMAVVAASLPAVGTAILLVLLKQTDIAPWLQAQGATGMALYIAGYVVLAGLALCNTYAPSLVGGFAFGIPRGGAGALAGVTLAAVGAYLGMRRLSGDRVATLIAEQPKWKAVHDALIGRNWGRTLAVVTLVRFSSSPFAITNLVFAATRVHPLIYVTGTLVGIAPRTLAAVAIGSSLSQWDPQASSRWLIVGGIIVTLIVFAILGNMANQAVQKVTQQHEAASKP